MAIAGCSSNLLYAPHQGDGSFQSSFDPHFQRDKRTGAGTARSDKPQLDDAILHGHQLDISAIGDQRGPQAFQDFLNL